MAKIRLYKCPEEIIGSCEGCFFVGKKDGSCLSKFKLRCGRNIYKKEKPEPRFIDVEIEEA